MRMSLGIRCNPGSFRLDKTYLNVVSRSEFKMFFLPYLAVSSKVRYFHDNDSSGRKINIFYHFR